MTFPHQPGYKYDPNNVITRQTADLIAHPLFENLLEAVLDFKSKIPGSAPSANTNNVGQLARRARELYELEVEQIDEDLPLTEFMQEAIHIFQNGSEQLSSINSMEAKFLHEYDMKLKEGTLWDIKIQVSTMKHAVDVIKNTEKRLCSAVQTLDDREKEEPASKKKKRGRFDKEVTELLVSWLLEHQHNPYPTASEKEALASSTGLDVNQIQNWFINMRKRHLAPLKNGKRNPRSFLDFVLRSNAVAQQSSVASNRYYQHPQYHNHSHQPPPGPRQMYQGQHPFPPSNMHGPNHHHHNNMATNGQMAQQHHIVYEHPPHPVNPQYGMHNNHLPMKNETYVNPQGMPMMQQYGSVTSRYDNLNHQPTVQMNENHGGNNMMMVQHNMQQRAHLSDQPNLVQPSPMSVPPQMNGMASYSGLPPDDERKMREFEDLLERIAGTEDSMHLFDEFSPTVEMHQV